MGCIKCGNYSGPRPLCEKCTEEILREQAARRRRMSIVFTFIILMAIVAYFYLL